MKLVSVSILVLAIAGIASAALNRTYSGNAKIFSINGATCLEVASWSGGDAVGAVTTQPATGKKQISSVSYTPLVVESRLPLSAALTDCLADLFANRATPRTLSLSLLDSSDKIASTVHAVNAVLDEVRFPELDGSSKDSFTVTFVFRIEKTQDTTPEPISATNPVRSQTLSSNFRLSIDGLPTNRVASIKAFTIKRGAPGKAVEFSDLSLSVSAIDEAGWDAWNESFIIKGANHDTAEKSGTLELLSPDMKTPIFTLKLKNLGLISLASPAPQTEAITRLNALLYVESISLPPSAPSTAKAAPDVLKAQDSSPAVKRSLKP